MPIFGKQLGNSKVLNPESHKVLGRTSSQKFLKEKWRYIDDDDPAHANHAPPLLPLIILNLRGIFV
jgi:hypothetical protein